MWAIIFLSFLGGLVFTFFQAPFLPNWVRPEWLILILFYWALILPQYVSIGIAWLVGLFLDMMYNVTGGEHAIALVLVTYLIVVLRQKIMKFEFLTMLGVIWCLMGLYKLSLFLMQFYLGEYFNGWSILSTTFVSVLVWPILMLLFDFQRNKYRT